MSVKYLAAKTFQVEITVEDYYSNCFWITRVARHYG